MLSLNIVDTEHCAHRSTFTKTSVTRIIIYYSTGMRNWNRWRHRGLTAASCNVVAQVCRIGHSIGLDKTATSVLVSVTWEGRSYDDVANDNGPGGSMIRYRGSFLNSFHKIGFWFALFYNYLSTYATFLPVATMVRITRLLPSTLYWNVY